jgi:acetoin utilization protein AcuC
LAGLGSAAVLSAVPSLAEAGEPRRATRRDARMIAPVCLYYGEDLGRYGFQDDHPFGIDRQGAFFHEAQSQSLDRRVAIMQPVVATRKDIERFHTVQYVDKVMQAEHAHVHYLDEGDTPVFPGMFVASSIVVGSALDGLRNVMDGRCLRTFQPIGGLHHAGRDHAAGFCVFNDLGVVIEALRHDYGVQRVAYVDIDVHFGDGVFYAFEDDPDLIFADIHEDWRSLYPGTGRDDETGKGSAAGTKLNINLKPGSGDAEFVSAWKRVEAHIEQFEPEFIVFQCGADGLKGDPLGGLNYTAAVHAHAARNLRRLADKYAKRRLMGFGGGGYDRANLAQAWCAVLREFSQS